MPKDRPGLIKTGRVEYHSEENGIPQIRIISKKLSDCGFNPGDEILIQILEKKIIIENIEGRKIVVKDNLP